MHTVYVLASGITWSVSTEVYALTHLHGGDNDFDGGYAGTRKEARLDKISHKRCDEDDDTQNIQ